MGPSGEHRRRALMMPATLVVLLLVLHHPLMGVMPVSAGFYHASATLPGARATGP